MTEANTLHATKVLLHHGHTHVATLSNSAPALNATATLYPSSLADGKAANQKPLISLSHLVQLTQTSMRQTRSRGIITRNQSKLPGKGQGSRSASCPPRAHHHLTHQYSHTIPSPTNISPPVNTYTTSALIASLARESKHTSTMF